MTAFDRTPAIRIVSSTLALTLLGAVAVFVLILITSAGQLSHAAAPATVTGPLGLFQLQKQADPSGAYQASISLLPGIWVYSTLWLLAATAATWARLRRSELRSS
jgi:hypothetical protein